MTELVSASSSLHFEPNAHLARSGVSSFDLDKRDNSRSLLALTLSVGEQMEDTKAPGETLIRRLAPSRASSLGGHTASSKKYKYKFNRRFSAVINACIKLQLLKELESQLFRSFTQDDKEYLLKTEGVRTVVLWIPFHAGVLGNEIVDGLANEGRSMPQPRKPLTLSDARSVLQRGTVRLWSAAQLSNDERFPNFYEAYKAGDYLQSLPRSDDVQIFRARAKHTPILADRARHGWSATTAFVFAGNRKKGLCMSCPNAGKWSVTAPADSPISTRRSPLMR
ncbi:Pol polyprotein [Plakobranchus ocellatus]|uniref:Pol polyprotein n=1 Tax=Plakobranchus ocellatus TaxID=259542 RepID=A0AAV3Y9U0_9GAST|nr:Pol polyprotein [Plakobranchus ocellatus]